MEAILEEEISEEDRKIYMTERRIKLKFMDEHLPHFAQLIDVDPEKLRVYAYEFPIRTNKDGVKSADILLEIEEENITPMANKMLVLEFKSKKVDYQSAVVQVLRYSELAQKQLYRHKRVLPFVVATGFSEHELKLAKENKVVPVQYDHKTGHMRIIKN